MKHPLWRLPVDDSALILMPCPGTKTVSVNDTLQQLIHEEGVVALVSAITLNEFKRNTLPDFKSLCADVGIQWFHLPIEDDEVPDSAFEQQWPVVCRELLAAMQCGTIALHCMGGSGRTGLLAARLLREKGWSLEQSIAQIRQRRPSAFTKQNQIDYIQNY